MKILIMALALMLSLPSIVSAEDLILGTLFELKGHNSLTAQEAMNGALLAVKKFNESSTDLKIKIDVESPTDEPLEIIKSAHRITGATGMSAATGIISSDAAMTAGPVFQSAQLPFLCTGAEANGLTNSETSEVFTLAAPDSKIGESLAKYTYETLQAENIFLIRASTSDSIADQSQSFYSNYKKLGGTVLKELMVTGPNSNLSFIITAMNAFAPLPETAANSTKSVVGVNNYDDDNADYITQKRTPPPEIQEIEAVVILASPKVSAELLSLMQEQKFGYNIVGGTNFDTVSMMQSIKSWTGNIIFASQASLTREDNLVTMFVKDYTEMFSEKPQTGYSALGFDSILLLAKTAGKTGNKSVNIRSNLPAVKNFQGVSGDISFHGHNGQKPIYIIQSDAGQISLAAEMK